MRKVCSIATALGALMTMAACSKEAPPADPLRPVLTMVVGTAAANDLTSYSGEVRSRVEQAIGFRIAGKISERLVSAGEVVKPGQILARLDPADTKQAASAAEAQQALADADLGRYRELKARNFVSQAALDSRETTLRAANAQAELAKNQTAYTVLRADQPGVVGEVLAEVGQVVNVGQAVYRIARQDTLEVAIAIPESRLAEARKASDAEVELWAEKGKVYKGRLREIAAMADPQTRTYAARVSILDADPQVVFGMTARVRFNTSRPGKAILIPQTALFQQGEKPAVWVVDREGKLALRAVEVAAYTDEKVRIEGGLTVGEVIVTAGVHKLRAGEKVRLAHGAVSPATTQQTQQ